MPYLNWKDRNALQQEIHPASEAAEYGSDRRLRMGLRLPATQLEELVSVLKEIFDPAQGGGELRVDLPREWIVFWKRRDGESRILVAHPQPEEWVATVALSSEDGMRLIGRLESASAGEAFSLDEWVASGNVSNLELVLGRLAG